MDGSKPVVDAVKKILEEQGNIPFERLMELALYHPRGGLYRRTVPSKGRSGLYTTCANIDPALGQSIAKWLERGWDQCLGKPKKWNVIEVGGGTGELAATVLQVLPWRLRRGLTLTMVEINETALSMQRERFGKKIRWESSMERALRKCQGRALIYSNELVDAFPAVVVERRDGQWLEVILVDRDGWLAEDLRPVGQWFEQDSTYSLAHLEGVREHTRGEVHRSFHSWINSWAKFWEKGWILTVDYGSDCRDLYGSGGDGTMRAYLSNLRLEEKRDLYHRLGMQDLTCDVNFTDLKKWGDDLGWTSQELMTQRDFLERFGQISFESEQRDSLSFITRPGGAGTYFRVLWQKNG